MMSVRKWLRTESGPVSTSVFKFSVRKILDIGMFFQIVFFGRFSWVSFFARCKSQLFQRKLANRFMDMQGRLEISNSWTGQTAESAGPFDLKPITAYVSQEWSEINKTRTEKVTQKKFITISKVSTKSFNQLACKLMISETRPKMAKNVEKTKSNI